MPSARESLPCHGKVNLFLEIHDRRPDGYHNLGTLFQTVDCGDLLHAEPWDTVELDCPDGITADKEQNLVVKAARLLGETFPERVPRAAGIRFTLEKRLPSAAGLGGGSSDAASALLLCNRVWKLDLGPGELLRMAAKLGSDVPFFLHSGAAFGEGRGESLRAAPDPHPFHVVIGTPHCRVETAWAYANLPGGRKRQWDRFKALYVTYFEDADFYQVLQNDFDAPMRAHFPEIQALADRMLPFSPVKTLLCGSGASVFSLHKERSDAEACLEAIKPMCRFSCLTGFIN